MGDYRVSYEVKNVTLEDLTRQVYASLYLAEIEGKSVRLTDITEGVEFDYPATRALIEELNKPGRFATGTLPAGGLSGGIDGGLTIPVSELKRAPGTMNMYTDEGDWQLMNDSHVGEDVE